MALVHDVAEAIVGDITPHCNVSRSCSCYFHHTCWYDEGLHSHTGPQTLYILYRHCSAYCKDYKHGFRHPFASQVYLPVASQLQVVP
jgi:hypothetical protein